MSSIITGDFCYEIFTEKTLSDLDRKLIEKKIDEIYSTLPRLGGKSAGKKPYVIVFSDDEKRICFCLSSKADKYKKAVDALHEENPPNKKIIISKDISIGNRREEIPETHPWWEGGLNIVKEDQYWTTLEYEGPYFPDLKRPYKPHGKPLIYKGKKYVLSPYTEKVAGFYAARILSEEGNRVTTELTKDPVFNNNYWMDFKEYLARDPAFRGVKLGNFEDLDFSEIVQGLRDKRESGKSPDVKDEKDTAKCLKNINYTYAVVDGVRQKIGSNIEVAGLFTGRGNQPKRGHIKHEIFPEDVTINIGPTAKIPPPPKGHKWGGIVHNNRVEYLARWKDKVTNKCKYVYLGHGSKYKSQSDLRKFEIARKLNKNISKVREEYMKHANSPDVTKRQTSTLIYLIDHYGFRPGGVKDDSEEADTVGISTLRREHITSINPEEKSISLSFLGKDSVPYDKTLIINDKVIMDNIISFIQGKNPGDLVFNNSSGEMVNTFLKGIDKDFTAKYFRTRLGSVAMTDELKKVQGSKDESDEKKKSRLDHANIIVAQALNHRRNITVGAKNVLEKNVQRVKDLKEKLEEGKKLGKKIERTEKALETAELRLGTREESLELAIHTSRKNYIDPRIFIAWAKRYELPIRYVFQPALAKQFQWAIDTTGENWSYDDKLVPGIEEKLEPMGGTTAEPKRYKNFDKLKKPQEGPKKTVADLFPKPEPRKSVIPVKSVSPIESLLSKIKTGESSITPSVKTSSVTPSVKTSSITPSVKTATSIEVKGIYNNLPREITLEYIENNRTELFPISMIPKDPSLKKQFVENKVLRKKVIRVYLAFIRELGFNISPSKNITSDGTIKTRIKNETTFFTIARMIKLLNEINMKPIAQLLFLGICEDCKTENTPTRNNVKKLYSIIQ